jgi:hypothetical protein
MVFYGNQRQLEYDFVVRPGSDPGDIRLQFRGADRMEIDDTGDLVLHVGNRQIRQRRPVLYQDRDGSRESISGGYRLASDHEAVFDVGGYDHSRTLVIDPILDWSTYLGGNDDDWAAGVAVNSKGDVIVVGTTRSTSWPFATQIATPGSKANSDIFLTAFGRDGVHKWTTIFGGNGPDEGVGVTIDKDDNIYITGTTASGDYPTSANALIREWPSLEFRPPFADTVDTGGAGSDDAILTKLDPTGTSYSYSTYIGGSPELVAKLRPNLALTGLKLSFTTNLGREVGRAIAVDRDGVAYVAGVTTSPTFPVTANAAKSDLDDTLGFYQTDAFVIKIDPKKSGEQSLLYSTYFGGNCGDDATGLAVGANGTIYITGYTEEWQVFCGSGAPTTPGAAHGRIDGGGFFDPVVDAYVAAFGPNFAAGAVVWSTHIGTDGHDAGGRIAVDADGKVYATFLAGSGDVRALVLVGLSADGTHELWNAPTLVGSMRKIPEVPASANNGLGDLTKDPIGGTFPHGLFLSRGLTGTELFLGWARASSDPPLALSRYATNGTFLSTDSIGDSSGLTFAKAVFADFRTAYIVGATQSATFPLSHAAQAAHGGSLDGVVARFVHNPAPVITASAQAATAEGSTITRQTARMPSFAGTVGLLGGSIDWGDGSSKVSAAIAQDTSGAVNFSGSHTYANNGTFTRRDARASGLRIEDVSGARGRTGRSAMPADHDAVARRGVHDRGRRARVPPWIGSRPRSDVIRPAAAGARVPHRTARRERNGECEPDRSGHEQQQRVRFVRGDAGRGPRAGD